MFSRGKIVAVLLFALFLVGFVFFRGPTPHVAIKPETIFDAGGIGFTNTMISSWLIVGAMIIGVFLLTRRWDLVPTGIQNGVEAVVEAFYNVVTNVAGEKNGRRFFPVVATIFFFVLISNWLSLLPIFNVIGVVQEEEHGFVMENASVGGLDVAYVELSVLSSESIDEDDPDAQEQYEQAHEDGKTVGELLPLLRGPNTDVNTPLALAIVSMIAVEFWGISTLGLFKYGKKFINFSSPIAFFVGFLELVSELVRLVSFTFRLFGNMFAGEVVILMFTFLTPMVVAVVFYGLELFVGVIQAFIFAMLTLVFGIMAVQSHDDHDGEEHSKKHEDSTATKPAEA
jgi:F-type H+-transporting ATPase subunit a